MNLKFAYTGIRVKDLEASIRFYTTLLGMKEVQNKVPGYIFPF